MPVSDSRIRSFIETVAQSAVFKTASHNDYIGRFLGRKHRHAGLYQISYVLKGRTRVLIGGRHYCAGEGDLLLIPPGRLHASGSEDERKRFELLQIKFSLPHCVSLPLPSYLRPGKPTVLLNLFYSLINEFHMQRPYRETLMRLDLARLIVLLGRQYSLKAGNRQLPLTVNPFFIERRMTKAIRYITANYARHLPLSEMAGVNGYSVSQFSHIFKQYTGISPVGYLINYRLSQALMLMTNTERKLEDIAAATGFSSAYYFSRLFKKRYNQSPRRYARLIYNSPC